jgi:hypothetical protein
VRVEDQRRLVLLDVAGPGCLDRLWFTRKRPWDEPYDLLIYVDGDNHPAIESDLDELFAGNTFPFVAPLAGRCGLARTPGLFALVPIAFREHCRVVLVPRAADEKYVWRVTESGERIRHVYYQITYRLAERPADVQAFNPHLDNQDIRDFQAARDLWSRAGESPWSPSLGLQSREATVRVGAGETAVACDIAGPAVVYEIQAVARDEMPAAPAAAALESLDLELHWDGAPSPSAAAPLPLFFNCPAEQADVRGFWAGRREGRFYCHWPMPFQRMARIALRNRGERDAYLDLVVKYRREELRPDDMRFGTHRYLIAAPARGRDNLLFTQQHAGHVVAIVMDRPGNMEGDDRWFVDGRSQPDIHGTGTEDFFNFAWGLAGNQALPQHGIVPSAGQPHCYRFLFPYCVPFRASLRLEWEHGHELSAGANQDGSQYSGLVVYYAPPS